MPEPAASTRSRVKRLHLVGRHRSRTTLVTTLIGNRFRIDGRAEQEQSLWDPIPPVEGIYLTKRPPDTLRIKRTFLLDPELNEIAMICELRGLITGRHPYNLKMLGYLWRRRVWVR